MRLGSLFSGIGGLELGLEQAGLGHTVWQVEQDAYCRSVLAQHWPNAERFTDVRTVGAANLAPVDVICGGFPCQDVSSAGKRAGLAGARSGLWYEFARIVGELRPSIVIVENVASGASKWVDAVRGDLEQLGYESLPVPLSAADVGAPHERSRIFIVAYANSVQLRHQQRGGAGRVGPVRYSLASSAKRGAAALATPTETGNQLSPSMLQWPSCRAWQLIHPAGPLLPSFVEWMMGFPYDWTLSTAPRTKRNKALGNAVVPQCAEVIGHIIRQLASGSK